MSEQKNSTQTGQPCVQDNNPPGLPLSETEGAGAVSYIYRRTPPCEHAEFIDNQTVGTAHTAPLSIPTQTGRGSDITVSDGGNPVVIGQPNAEDVERMYYRLSSSTGTSQFSDLDGSWGSGHPESSRGSGQGKPCSSCKLLMKQIKCDCTKKFWLDIDTEGPEPDKDCHIKFGEKFIERLKDTFPREEGLKKKTTVNLIKCILHIDPKDPIAGVELARLKRAIDLFGPIKDQGDGRCVFVNQLNQLASKSLRVRDTDKKVKTSWFAGEMSRDEAERVLLKESKDKTYLVRISSTDGENGDFAVSVRHDDHCHHLKIQGDPEKALAENPYHAHLKFAGSEFKSLTEVVEYIEKKREIKLEADGENDIAQKQCASVTCLRVFTKSPLNAAMAGYEKTKR